jgi:hypothetical protein
MNQPSAESSPFAAGLDAAALDRLRELDPDGRHGVLRRVLSAFESSLERMLARLEAERAGGHAEVVAGIAHTLKSSSASVGALALAATCAEVESRWRGAASQAAGTDPALEADIVRLCDLGAAALAAVRAMLRP